VGRAAAVHLVTAHPAYPATTNESDPPWIEYDIRDDPLLEEILVAPLRPVRGVIPVPTAPGLGVEPDRAALARFRRQ
jgi:D-galactarolactone cycloisomerase